MYHKVRIYYCDSIIVIFLTFSETLCYKAKQIFCKTRRSSLDVSLITEFIPTLYDTTASIEYQ